MSWRRFVFATDIHGDRQDSAANRALFRFLAQWKPVIRVCGGDLWDFRPLRAKASAEEQRESMRDDFEAGMQWAEQFKPTHLLKGNHDERLWKLAEQRNGPKSDFAIQLIEHAAKRFAPMRTAILPYDRRTGIVRIGSLKCVHGFVAGVNAARRTAQTYGSVLMGHGHAIQHVSIEGIENRVGRMVGCLCQLDMDYVAANLASLVWRHGWAYGVVNDRTDRYQVWQAESVDGRWLLPTGFEEL